MFKAEGSWQEDQASTGLYYLIPQTFGTRHHMVSDSSYYIIKRKHIFRRLRNAQKEYSKNS